MTSLQPWARAVVADRNANELEPHTRCKASGVPRQFLTPYGVEIVEVAELNADLHSSTSAARTPSASSTWTAAATRRTSAQLLRPFDRLVGRRHAGRSTPWASTRASGSIAATRRTPSSCTRSRSFTRTDCNAMRYDLTVDDPGAYTKPWTATMNLRLENGTELFEYVCQQQNYAHELMVGQHEQRRSDDAAGAVMRGAGDSGPRTGTAGCVTGASRYVVANVLDSRRPMPISISIPIADLHGAQHDRSARHWRCGKRPVRGGRSRRPHRPSTSAPTAAAGPALARLPDFSRRAGDRRRRRRCAAGGRGAACAGRSSRRPRRRGARNYRRRRAAGQPDRELPAARHARHHGPALSDGIPADAGQGDDRDRGVSAGPAHLHRRPTAARRSGSEVPRHVDRPLGGRHAGRRDRRLLAAHRARPQRAAQRQDAHRRAIPSRATPTR